MQLCVYLFEALMVHARQARQGVAQSLGRVQLRSHLMVGTHMEAPRVELLSWRLDSFL